MDSARKGGAFPHSGAAEPRELLRTFANLDSLDIMSPLTGLRKFRVRYSEFCNETPDSGY